MNANILNSINFYLYNYFQLCGLKKLQKECLSNLFQKKNVIAILPAGYGKSLIYQLFALMQEKTVLVVSPLISLMYEQAKFSFEKLGLSILVLNSRCAKNKEEISKKLAENKYKLIFTTPESLFKFEKLVSLKKSLIVIDEAHCISFWGYNFRPAYLKIIDFLKKDETPFLMLSATMPDAILNEILNLIENSNVHIVKETSLKRNIRINIIKVNKEKDKYGLLLSIIKKIKGSGIVYTGTREESERLTHFLLENDIDALYYHGGLSKNRKEIQNLFMENKIDVLVATSSFGMGINKPDIRYVINFRLPNSIEEYYQQFCRAGRDNQTAYSFLFYYEKDLDLNNYLIYKHKPKLAIYNKILSKLYSNKGKSFGQILYEKNYENKTLIKGLNYLVQKGFANRTGNTFLKRKKTFSKENLSIYDKAIYKEYQRLDTLLQLVYTENCYWKEIIKYLDGEVTQDCKICSNCTESDIIDINISKNYASVLKKSLENYHPILKKTANHNGGLSISYYKDSSIGNELKQVKKSINPKHTKNMIERCLELIKANFNIKDINIITNVPGTINYDLCGKLCREIASELKIKYLKILNKNRITIQQKFLNSKQKRKNNVKNAFDLNVSKTEIENKKILLIDDIYDSGCTINECCKVIKQFNPENITIFTLCKTYKHW